MKNKYVLVFPPGYDGELHILTTVKENCISAHVSVEFTISMPLQHTIKDLRLAIAENFRDGALVYRGTEQ